MIAPSSEIILLVRVNITITIVSPLFVYAWAYNFTADDSEITCL